jgi:hypothetical protein
LPLFLLALVLVSPVESQTASGNVNGTDNGIAVGRPKIYDNRSLQIMLDSFNASLQNAQFFNQSTLSAAFGLLQGTESFDVTRNLSVAASLVPKSPPPSTSISGNVGQNGPGTGSLSATIPGSGGGPGSSGSSSAASSQGQATTPATLPTLSPSSAQFGSNPNDLLADQVNLTYQVFNLRMLLERSLTDRLLTEQPPLRGGRTRLQAVIGFNVTLDPPKEAKDSAAIIEIKITPQANANPRTKLSLVAVMPQEKTYNSAALNTHDNAFGGSAVAKMITVGYTERHRGQVFYLFRDNDTMAFERMPPRPDDGRDIKFGWQFRPVLGRRSVAPGTREMFAIIALPEADEPEQEDPVSVNIQVTTYWKHYDHRSLTTTYHEPWVHYINPAGVASIPLRLPGSCSAEYRDVEVPRSARIQDNLSPEIRQVEWIPTSNQTGTVVVHGKNFFSGTTVSLAGQQYTTPADGLILQSDQTMIISTTVQAVAMGDGVVYGRYGRAVLLEPNMIGNAPIRVQTVELRPLGSEYFELTLKLRKPGGPLRFADAPTPNALFVRYNDAVLDVPTKVAPDDTDPDMLDVVTTIPNTVLGTGDGIVTVKFPFGGKSWEAKHEVYQPLLPVVTRTGGKDKTTLAIAYPRPYGSDFRGSWRIILDKSYQIGDPGDVDADTDVSVKRAAPCSAIEPSCHIVILTAKTSLLDTYQKFVIVSNQGDFISVSIPPSNPIIQAAQISKINTISMLQNEARAVVFYGQGLTSIKRVFFSNQDLPFFAKGDGTNITVFISPDITSKPGHKDIVFQVDQNTLLPGGIDVLPSGGNPPPIGNNANPNQNPGAQ